MRRRFQPTSSMLIAGLCAVAIFVPATLVLAVPAGAIAMNDFDLQQSLPTLGVWDPVAIITLRFIASLIGVVPTSPLLLAAGASQGVLLSSLYVLIGAEARRACRFSDWPASRPRFCPKLRLARPGHPNTCRPLAAR